MAKKPTALVAKQESFELSGVSLDLDANKSLILSPTTKERLLKKVTVLENGCWQFNGSLHPLGYGWLGTGRRSVGAHRVAYALFKGEVPKGYELDHTCHSRDCPGGPECPHRRCCNPDHLEPVLHQENVRRGHGNRRVVANRKARTHCPKGHEYTQENTYWYRGYRMCRCCHRATEYRRFVRLFKKSK